MPSCQKKPFQNSEQHRHEILSNYSRVDFKVKVLFQTLKSNHGF